MPTAPSRPVKTVETTYKLLLEIRQRKETTLDELDATLEPSRSTIHRHLHTLENLHLVTVKDGQYRISLRFLDFGLHARRQCGLYNVAAPKVDEIAKETGEKVWCIVEEYGRSIHLYGASGRNSVKTHAKEGQVGYLHQLAAGKAILSTFSQDYVNEMIENHGLPAQTKNTITERNKLFKELANITEQGYAFNNEESVPRLRAVGAPITDNNDVAIGAISISAPSNRIRGDLLQEEFPKILLGATNEIEINLNFS